MESLPGDSYWLLEGDESDLGTGGNPPYQKQKLETSEAFSDDPVFRFVDNSVEIHSIKAIEHRVETQQFRISEKPDFGPHVKFTFGEFDL